MSLNNIPSKEEVMEWTPLMLADYMRRLKLSNCDKVVMKGSISGAQFMRMTECDLQVFPTLSVSIIAKIQNDIYMGQQKKVFGQKSKAQTFPKQVFVQDETVWDSDEFESDSENDEEGQQQERGKDSNTANHPPSDEDSEEEYELPPAEDAMKPPRHPRVAKLLESHHRGPVPEPSPAERTSKHQAPPPPRPSRTPQKPSRTSAPTDKPNLDRSKKPGQSTQLQKIHNKSKGTNVKAADTPLPRPRTHKPKDVANSESKLIPALVPTPAKVNNSIPGPGQGLDPSWYGGKVTRRQAEVSLREVNKDGAFVVRDSSKGSAAHPYTLMLLKQSRVYNIKIRNQGNSYSLGTGLKNTKSFPGVREMITHHTHTPLLLIDATVQSSEAQSQCCLLHPAGL